MEFAGHFRRSLSGKGILVLILTGISLGVSCTVKRSVVKATESRAITYKPDLKKSEVDFQGEFSKIFKRKSSGLIYPELLRTFYEGKQYQPVLVTRFVPENQLQILLNYLLHSGKHGLDPELFEADRIQKLLEQQLENKPEKQREIYRDHMELELYLANGLIRYSIAMQYGVVDPAELYIHYETPTLRPDSAAIVKILEVAQLKSYLDSIQPKGRQYRILQKALIAQDADSLKKNKPMVQLLSVNMERLRWQDKPDEQKYVLVNIANCSLEVIDQKKMVLHMNVCVGEKGDRQTPQLSSKIYSIQVNPVWNIPQSIARNETTKNAAEDRYYLDNNNIKVYKMGKLVPDPESIDWFTENADDYSFKQQPGEQNALGRIKFLFYNESSVYLHDTPLQRAFKQKKRAISHGCVRVEKPLELVYALFGQTEKYEQIKRAMSSGYPKAKFIGLPKPIPIKLVYYTAWADDAGKIQSCADIYGMDGALYQNLKTFAGTGNE